MLRIACLTFENHEILKKKKTCLFFSGYKNIENNISLRILKFWNFHNETGAQRVDLRKQIINWRFPTICDSFPTRATVMGPFTVGGDVRGVGPGHQDDI